MVDELSPWLRGPWTLRDAGSGINNASSVVETADGRYFLRVYQNTRGPERVAYEHAVLRALACRGLSFAVPEPLPTRAGATWARLPDGRLASLFGFLPGQPPRRGDPAHLRAFGAALAELHAALARIEVCHPPASVVSYGALARVHPSDAWPDPAAVAEDLPLAADDRSRLRAVLLDLLATVPRLYRSLPVQVIHGDAGPGNSLFDGDRVAAVLDFEFSGPDLRAVDVAVGAYWSARSGWGTDSGLQRLAAFGAGYASGGGLAPAEVAALPLLARLERAAGLVHWVGRWRVGLAEPHRPVEQAQRLLDLDAWLVTNATAYAEALAGRRPQT